LNKPTNLYFIHELLYSTC